MIQHLSLKHGWFYHYRVHTPKTKELCAAYPGLRQHLEEMLVRGKCPDECFSTGPRSSALKFPLGIAAREIDHPVTRLAAAGLAEGAMNTAHSNVQMFLLKHDKSTVAVEVPLWWHEEEMGAHAERFSEPGPLSGHIDLLRIEDGNVWVWDYKPRAHLEKFAATQTYFYALMLAARTGVPLERLRCGWFDDKKAYVFEPAAMIKESAHAARVSAGTRRARP